jgi:hypothetical protein
MQLKIDQIAITPPDAAAAHALLKRMGAAEWVEDTVVAGGTVFGQHGSNVANLLFNYELSEGPFEFEILDYNKGPNWCSRYGATVSHLGMHCSEEELKHWKSFFAAEGIGIAQEVRTQSHTNQYLIDNERKYWYCIFDTRPILGVDIKFIVRVEGQ